jgi:hypothetical protein
MRGGIGGGYVVKVNFKSQYAAMDSLYEVEGKETDKCCRGVGN